MRILWQNEHFPDPIKGGGGAINTKYIVSALNELGHETTILARGPEDHAPFHEEVYGLRVQRVALPKLPEKLWPIWPILEPRYAAKTLAELISPYDAFVGIDTWFALAAKKLHPEKPLIYRIEGSERTHDAAVEAIQTQKPRQSLSCMQRWVQRFCSCETDLVERHAWRISDFNVVKSEFMKNELKRCYAVDVEKIQVIPNGVDYERYAKADVDRSILMQFGNDARSKVVITYSGRLVPMKNISFLLRAFRGMENRDSAILVILGEGEDRQALQDEARELGIGEQTKFLGHSSVVEKFLAATDIFVLPSVYEPFGNALVEAMAAGVACVALRPDAVKVRTAADEILADGRTGFLVSGDSPYQLSEKFDLLACNRELRKMIGRAGQASCRDRYDWRRCASRYLTLLRGASCYEPKFGTRASDGLQCTDSKLWGKY